jgi:hypothetical protein
MVHRFRNNDVVGAPIETELHDRHDLAEQSERAFVSDFRFGSGETRPSCGRTSSPSARHNVPAKSSMRVLIHNTTGTAKAGSARLAVNCSGRGSARRGETPSDRSRRSASAGASRATDCGHGFRITATATW